MSKDEFVLHEWNKELFDDLVKYNEIEDATNEGKNIGIKESKAEIAKNLFNMKMSIEDISKATGLTLEEVQKLKKDK